jgi:hypothetical protein
MTTFNNPLNTWNRLSSTQSGTGKPEWVRTDDKGRNLFLVNGVWRDSKSAAKAIKAAA